jgi:predicted metal-dependent hydrolase
MSFNNEDVDAGLDLFNRGSFFDAHEVLEEVWRSSSLSVRRDHLKRHLQGLVQLAVAFHHYSRGNFVGARSVLDRALRNLSEADGSFPHLDLARLRVDLAHWQAYFADCAVSGNLDKICESTPALPRIYTLGPPRV